jgi:hypothetical protein
MFRAAPRWLARRTARQNADDTDDEHRDVRGLLRAA